MSRRSELLTGPFLTLHERKQSRHFVTALNRGLEILALFNRDVRALGNDEISKRTGLPRSTVTRLTFTLAATRHLVYVPSIKKYKIGPAALAWSYAAMENSVVSGAVRSFMQDFASQIEASTVALSVNVGLEMIYIAHCAGPAMVQVRTDVGTRLKLWESATGRTYWSAVDEATREGLRAELLELPEAEQDNALALLHEAEIEFKKYGFCTSLGGWRAGVNAVGCPTRNPENDSELFIISCGGTNPEFDADTIYGEIGPRLKEFAQLLGPRLVHAGLG